MLIFAEGGKPKQNSTSIWHQNPTRVTLMGGECSHHCAIPAFYKYIEDIVSVWQDIPCVWVVSVISRKSAPFDNIVLCCLITLQRNENKRVSNLNKKTTAVLRVQKGGINPIFPSPNFPQIPFPSLLFFQI